MIGKVLHLVMMMMIMMILRMMRRMAQIIFPLPHSHTKYNLIHIHVNCYEAFLAKRRGDA